MFSVKFNTGRFGSSSKLVHFGTFNEAIMKAVLHVEEFNDKTNHHYNCSEIYFNSVDGQGQDKIADIRFSSGMDDEAPNLQCNFTLSEEMYRAVFGGISMPKPVEMTPQALMLAQLAQGQAKQLR